ncbi:hypothetical protein B0H11DRAFT_292510 [Mycena galericulata]|nr:hypothetical protein B0H11DRAFT_292510 [Mycena galericulata]
MIPGLTQLLPRVFRRCIASPAVVLNALPTASSAKPSYPRPTTPYGGLTISGTWNNEVGNAIAPKDERTPGEKWRDSSLHTVPNLQRRQPADAYQGRCVRVKAGNFAEAARDLDRILARNRVRTTVRSTERHEKKGVKRRRIKSEQWRKHFAHQVRKNVQLVHKIRRRGV